MLGSSPLSSLRLQTRAAQTLSQVFPTPVTLPLLCPSVHTHTHSTYTPLHAHTSSSFVHTGHWNVFLAQTPELKVTASPDKETKTL